MVRHTLFAIVLSKTVTTLVCMAGSSCLGQRLGPRRPNGGVSEMICGASEHRKDGDLDVLYPLGGRNGSEVDRLTFLER